ncbi:hypothetical protein D3C84_1146020 [compost metagenome]
MTIEQSIETLGTAVAAEALVNEVTPHDRLMQQLLDLPIQSFALHRRPTVLPIDLLHRQVS